MGDLAYLGAIAQDSSILVPENALKANQYRRSPERFDFTDADKVYDFAAQNRMAFRGHTLCWFNSVPDWVSRTLTTPQAIRRELVAEVMEPVRHFAGRMQSWDVVNEVLRPEEGQELGLRKSFWQQALGPEFIDLAFHVARENDPDAILCLNEMDLEYDHAYFETKRQALLALLKRLVAAKVPIGAVGIQCHLQYVQIRKFPFSKTVFQRLLSDIAELGLKVIISELDVPDRNLPADVTERDTIVADAIGDLLSVAVDHPAVIAIVTWCLSDRYSWMSRDPTFRRSDGLRSRGTLLDDALAPKPAYWAVVKALDAASVQRG
jgi:endo-1,4-beta-xylanase